MSDAGQHGGDTPKKYTDEELDAMSRDDLVKLGTNLDGVDVVKPGRHEYRQARELFVGAQRFDERLASRSRNVNVDHYKREASGAQP